MARREMFEEQQRIAIEMSGIDTMSLEQFLSRCTCFDPKEKLDYQLPTPEEVYNNFSKYNPGKNENMGERRETETEIRKEEDGDMNERRDVVHQNQNQKEAIEIKVPKMSFDESE